MYTHHPLCSTPTIKTALCTSDFAPVPHLRRDVAALKVRAVDCDSTSSLVHKEFIHTSLRMSLQSLPFLEIFLGFIGFGLSIMFCTTFCRACNRLREEQIEAEALRRSEHEVQPRPIYFIPFRTEGTLHPDSEDRLSGDLQPPPRYSVEVRCGPPPSYNELDFKPDDLPPAYTERDLSVNSTGPHSVIIDTQSPQ